MIIVRNAAQDGFGVLPMQEEQANVEYEYHKYLIFEGDLIYNAFTGEIVKDVDVEKDRDQLIKKWYMAPKGMDMSSLLYLSRQESLQKSHSGYVNSYTIFTTMSCNAACEYCFQHGGDDSKMSDQMAGDVAEYISKHANPRNEITITWFGGEPLVNKQAITIISRYLRNHNLNVRATISTNGDLFSEVSDAEIYLWNLKRVQLTVDIPGEEYGRIKGLPAGAYERLKKTVERLSSLGVRVQIRTHYHPEFGLEVAKSIVDDFKVYPNVVMYPSMIYDIPKTLEDYQNMAKLEEYMVECGVLRYNPIAPRRPVNCMADDENIRCIRVDGTLTACEHFSEGEQYGTIYSDEYDAKLLKKWKAKRKYTKQCYDCPLFPTCEIIDSCPSTGICEDGYKFFKIEQVRLALRKLGGSK